MEDEFESSARLLPAAEAKQVENKPAAESQPSETKESKVSEMLLLPAAKEIQADSKPAADCEPAQGKEESGVFQMQLLFAPEEEPSDSTPAVESKPAESQEESAFSAMQLLYAADESQFDSTPAVESKPAEMQGENKVSAMQVLHAAKETQAENKPAVESKHAQNKAVEKKAFERPFRVKLRGSVLVLVRLPNKRLVRAAIHQLSTSGGVIHFDKPLDEKLEVELIFHLQKVTIRGKAQMLFPMWATQGWMQPFRFVNLAESSRGVLDEKLKSFLGEAKGAAAGA